MMEPGRGLIEALRKEYPSGTRVELVKMDDRQAPPIGTRGTVIGVDDIGSLLMKWDNGSGLNVVYGEDVVRKIVVTTICGGKKDEWTSRKEAAGFFLEAMMGTDGSEHERYSKIYEDIMLGLKVCTDEGED